MKSDGVSLLICVVVVIFAVASISEPRCGIPGVIWALFYIGRSLDKG